MSVLIVGSCLLACLSASNGANDVSRAAATLLGGGLSSYRGVLSWVAAWTLAGSLASLFLAASVGQRFAVAMAANGGAQLDVAGVVMLSAVAWIGLATHGRLPVATTHAVLGALVGVAWFGGGWEACRSMGLVRGFILPLVSSPLIALAVAGLGQFCFGRARVADGRWLGRLHWVSSGLVAFSRGVNDSAKLWALILPMAVANGLSGSTAMRVGVLIVAGSMLAGSVLFGRRVTQTFAFSIRRMGHVDSAVANLSTALVIGCASLLSFPVASSHVVGGAIVGSGLSVGRGRMFWKPLVEILSAWVLTLPTTAVLSIGLLYTVRRFEQATLLGAGEMVLAASAALLGASMLIVWGAGGWRRSIDRFGSKVIVFVCSSNTSRSPMAAEICKALQEAGAARARRGRINAISRGLSVVAGTPMTSDAGDALVGLGMKAGSHRSAALSHRVVDKAAAIYCMTEGQQNVARAMFPWAASKIYRLVEDHDIDDPSGGGRQAYLDVAAMLQRAVSARLAMI